MEDNKHPLFKAVENAGILIFIPPKLETMSYKESNSTHTHAHTYTWVTHTHKHEGDFIYKPAIWRGGINFITGWKDCLCTAY